MMRSLFLLFALPAVALAQPLAQPASGGQAMAAPMNHHGMGAQDLVVRYQQAKASGDQAAIAEAERALMLFTQTASPPDAQAANGILPGGCNTKGASVPGQGAKGQGPKPGQDGMGQPPKPGQAGMGQSPKPGKGNKQPTPGQGNMGQAPMQGQGAMGQPPAQGQGALPPVQGNGMKQAPQGDSAKGMPGKGPKTRDDWGQTGTNVRGTERPAKADVSMADNGQQDPTQMRLKSIRLQLEQLESKGSLTQEDKARVQALTAELARLTGEGARAAVKGRGV